MATSIDSSLSYHYNEDLDMLSEAFNKENFVKQFIEFAEEFRTSEKLKHFENELRKYEKQRGVDINFVKPSPGIALTIEDSDTNLLTVINIGVDNKMGKPSFISGNTNKNSGFYWKIPHAFAPPRQELSENLMQAGLKGLPTTIEKVWVYDVIVNSICMKMIQQNQNLKKHLIEVVTDNLQNNYKLNLKKESLVVLEFGTYFGTATISQIKSIIDSTKYEISKKDDFKYPLVKMNQGLKNVNEIDNYNNNSKKEELIPSYKLKYIDHICLQDFSNHSKQMPLNLRPQSVALQIHLPGITKAAQIDVTVSGRKFQLQTEGRIFKLDLQLSYPIEEDPSKAKFDISTSELHLEFSIVKSVDKPVLISGSTDSGIECDSECRTNSEGETMSTSSQEDCCDITEQQENEDIKSLLLPSYSVSQTISILNFQIQEENVLRNTINFKLIDQSLVKIYYCNIGEGLTPLHFGLVIDVSPNCIQENGVKYKVYKKHIMFTMEKLVNYMWKDIKIGSNKAKLEKHSLNTVNQSKETLKNRGKSSSNDDSETTITEESPLPPLSEIQNQGPAISKGGSLIAVATPKKSIDHFRTGSYPKGILKTRERSYSDSCLTFGEAYGSSIEYDNDITDDANSPAGTCSDKKIVRFSGVVSKQLFRINSSILVTHAKNQRKHALRKRNERQRSLSEGNQDDKMFASILLDSYGNSSGNNTATTTTDEDTNDVKKKYKKGAKKTSRKGGKRGTNRKKLTLSNDMIFQLDDV